MGSCSSVHKTQKISSNNNSNMKMGLSLVSKNDTIVIPPSPIKPQNTNFRVLPDYTNNGSKEEAFYDSKAWLDSDTEDDFFSVNGDFTPSRGNTPVHHTFRTPVINKSPPKNMIPGSMPEPSPTERKKKLLDLFRESVREDKENGAAENTLSNDEKKEAKPILQDLLPKSARSTPYISGANSACSSERTMNDDHAYNEEKPVKSAHCCLPSLVSCRSFSERRKASPAVSANGKA